MTQELGPARRDRRPWLGPRSGSFGLRRLLTAQGGSFLGDGLVLAAFPLIAVHLSRTPGAVAGVGLAATLPQFLVALPADLVTDRAERRWTMATALTLTATALATLAALPGAVPDDLAVLDAVAIVVGAAQVLIAASGSALLPRWWAPTGRTARTPGSSRCSMRWATLRLHRWPGSWWRSGSPRRCGLPEAVIPWQLRCSPVPEPSFAGVTPGGCRAFAQM